MIAKYLPKIIHLNILSIRSILSQNSSSRVVTQLLLLITRHVHQLLLVTRHIHQLLMLLVAWYIHQLLLLVTWHVHQLLLLVTWHVHQLLLLLTRQIQLLLFTWHIHQLLVLMTIIGHELLAVAAIIVEMIAVWRSLATRAAWILIKGGWWR